MPRGALALLGLTVGYGFLWYKSMRENKSIGAAAVETISSAGQLLARGLRNNNPGNIRISAANWQGKIAPNTDGAFEQFDTPENGIRAIAKILKKYSARGVNTIDKIIRTWAPANENNSDAYVAAVEKKTGINRHTVLLYPHDLYAIVPAIIKHENGINPYTADVIADGIGRS